MIRVHVVVEGQTEELFVKEMLYYTFIEKGIHLIPHLVGEGGIPGYGPVKRDILNYLKIEKSSYCTTMIDFFRIPDDFPGLPAQGLATEQKAEKIEKAFYEDMKDDLGEKLRPYRFIPYIQMHEFEGLLFSDPDLFAEGIRKDDLKSDFNRIRKEFPSPEDINETKGPSKRIKEVFPTYKKVRHGSIAAIHIGFEKIKDACSHFRGWIEKIESLQEI